VALEASPIHPLVVQAKPEATIEHIYSAIGKHYIQSVFSITKFHQLKSV